MPAGALANLLLFRNIRHLRVDVLPQGIPDGTGAAATQFQAVRDVQILRLVFDVVQNRISFQNELRVALMIVQRSFELPPRRGRQRNVGPHPGPTRPNTADPAPDAINTNSRRPPRRTAEGGGAGGTRGESKLVRGRGGNRRTPTSR